MKPVKKLTLSAMTAALCTAALFLGSLMPNMSLPLAALAGLFPAVVVIVCGFGWAFGVYVAVSLLAFLLLPNKGAAALFLCFFGHYPIWKALIEAWQTRRRKAALGWGIKLIGTALCLGIMYLVFRGLLFSGENPVLFSSDSGSVLMLLFGAMLLAFAAYDVAFSILIGWFRIHILPRIK